MSAGRTFTRAAITQRVYAVLMPAVVAIALSVSVVAPAHAKDSGTVIRLDQPAGVVMLEGGRMYRITSSTVLSVEGKPVAFKSLQPGASVAIENGEPVIYRDRRYIAMKPAPATPPAVASDIAAPQPVTPPPARVVTERPAVEKRDEPPVKSDEPVAASVETRPPSEPMTVRRTVYGVVTDIDGDGRVKIKTDRDSFEARLEPESLRDINRGDTVVIDLSISPPGAASPR